MLPSTAESIGNVHKQFSSIFIGGLPRLLNPDGGYLSFICVFSGTEALAGFRFADEAKNGVRFQRFLADYYEPRYGPLADKFWDLRNSMVHSFAPRHFSLTQHQSQAHFADPPPYMKGQYLKSLNAEDVYAAFVTASEKYFQQLWSDAALQALFEQRVAEEGGLSVR